MVSDLVRKGLMGIPREMYPSSVRSVWRQCLEVLGPHFVVFTDGSLCEDGTGVGWFGQEDQECSISCPFPTGIFTAELTALYMACPVASTLGPIL